MFLTTIIEQDRGEDIDKICNGETGDFDAKSSKRNCVESEFNQRIEGSDLFCIGVLGPLPNWFKRQPFFNRRQDVFVRAPNSDHIPRTSLEETTLENWKEYMETQHEIFK